MNGPTSRPDPEAGSKELLDLPLGPGEAKPSAARAAAPPEKPPGKPPEKPPIRPSRRRWRLALGALALVLVGAAVGLLWPRGAPPVARLSATLLEFGEQRSGAAGEARQVVLTNAGQRHLEVAAVALAGEAPEAFELAGDGCTGRRLAAGEACTLELRFAPTPGASGRRTALLEIAGAFPNSPVQLPLLATATAPLLSLERRRIDFGEQPVETVGPAQAVAVQNRGTASMALGKLTVEGEGFVRQADFCSGVTLHPGERCSVEVAFQPMELGERQGTLILGHDAGGEPARVTLLGIAVPAVARLDVEPPRLELGEQALGGTAPATLRLSNPTREPVPIHGVAVATADEPADFAVVAETCTAGPLAPGADCTVRIVFAPRREGEAAGELVLDFGDSRQSRVSLAGVGVQARLTFAPGSLDLGTVRVGAQAEAPPITLVSLGSGAATVVGLVLTGPDAGAFAIDRDGCSGQRLPPAAECTVGIVFRPRRDGRHQARLAPRAELGSGAAPEAVLMGRGIAPRLALSPAEPRWREVPVGTSQGLGLKLGNPGGAPLTLRRLGISGGGATEFSLRLGGCGPTPKTLAPGSSCEVEVVFEPSRPGRRSAALTLDHDGLEGPKRLELAATALPPPVPELTLDPPAYAFEDQPVGRRSGILTVTLSNSGSSRLELSAIALAGRDAGDFQIVPGSCDGLPFLAPGGDCTVGLRFVPTAAGERRARLDIGSNAGAGRRSVELVGRGLEAPVP